MGQMNMPAAPDTYSWKLDYFRGADLTGETSDAGSGRAAQCPNMIRDSIGRVRKRTGYSRIGNYSGRINGVFTYMNEGEERTLIHSGKTLTAISSAGQPISYASYTGLADARSQARQLGKWLCILDGRNIWLYGRETDSEGKADFVFVRARDRAYVPTILIGRSPDGGGTVYEPINMLTSVRKEQFLGVANKKVYRLSSKNIDTTVTATVMKDADGTMVEYYYKIENGLIHSQGIVVDYKEGTVTFSTAPGVSPVLGKDNVTITYSKTIQTHNEQILKCRFCTLYGVNGARNRLFVTGNDAYPNRDYYSQIDDPTYFGDTWYSELGSGGARIVGYSVVGDQLATHLKNDDGGTNIVLRRGQLSEVSTTSGSTTVLSSTQSTSTSTSTTALGSTASFRISGSLQCPGAASPYGFATLDMEPLFVAEADILAVTPSDVLGERYAQSRAYYIKSLLSTLDLSESCAVYWEGYYVLAAEGYLILLDGTQPVYERNEPYASRQYEAYYWTDIPARVLFVQDGKLFFGDESGGIYSFRTDYASGASFHDDAPGGGKEIYACWCTPQIYGNQFYYRKDFRRISALLGSAIATGCRIWAIYDGVKELLRDYDGTARYFSYANLQYSKMCYKTDKAPQKLLEKIKIKKADSVAFLFENGMYDEPFVLYQAAAEYTQRL